MQQQAAAAKCKNELQLIFRQYTHAQPTTLFYNAGKRNTAMLKTNPTTKFNNMKRMTAVADNSRHYQPLTRRSRSISEQWLRHQAPRTNPLLTQDAQPTRLLVHLPAPKKRYVVTVCQHKTECQRLPQGSAVCIASQSYASCFTAKNHAAHADLHN